MTFNLKGGIYGYEFKYRNKGKTSKQFIKSYPKAKLEIVTQENYLDFIVDKALEENVDAVLFAGDAYKTRDPNPTQQRGFGERIKKIAKNMPLFIFDCYP